MHDEQLSDSTVFSRYTLWAAAIALGLSGCAHKGQTEASMAPKAVGQALAKPVEPTPAPIVEQHALDHLKAMSDKLATAKSFTYHARSSVEMPIKTGQFTTHFVETDVALERPDKLRVIVTGDLPNYHFFYDGASVSVFDPASNLYATTKAPGTIDEMLPFVMQKAGIDFHAADFLYSNPYAELTLGLTHAVDVGPARVNGVPTEHFAFMGPAANWEIWIDANSLPRRLATTHKTVANFPRFQIEFLDWNLKPKLSAGDFAFKKPLGAKEIEFGSRTDNPPQ